MKIVQAVGWYYPGSLGGTEVYVASLCHWLVAAGHDVLVAAPDATAREEQIYEYDGVPIYRYPIPLQPTRAECQGTKPVRGAERFHEWLQQQHPDIVHFHTFVTGLGLAEVRAAKAVGARVIVTTHAGSLGYLCQRGTMMRWGKTLCDGVCSPSKCAACALQHRGLAKPLAWAIGTLPPAWGKRFHDTPGKLATALGMSALIAHNQAQQRELLAVVDAFVVLTQWAVEAVAANGAPREKLICNRLGVSQTMPARKPPPEQRPTTLPLSVGYVGRFDAIKGVHDLARAIVDVPRTLPLQVEFRGPTTSETERGVLRELRATVGDDPRVTFAPAVTTTAMPQILAGYDILCCPAVCLEGGPTVAIEAHAVGTPVIGTRIGGLAELITDGVNGKLVRPGNWRELAGVLRAIVVDPHGTVDAWRRALPIARTMDEVTADYLALYAGRH